MTRNVTPSTRVPRAAGAGRWAEDLACRHLGDHGLRLLQRNYRCRGGEIDLVMQDGTCVVFVEVRFRRSTRFGGALESIDDRKQRKLIMTASQYLQAHADPRWQTSRFDVVCVSPGRDAPDIDWIRDAFQA